MEIRNIFIILDVEQFTKDDVVNDLIRERYLHNFFFANFHPIDVALKQLEMCDEVWLFGDCKDIVYYKLAKKRGADIWQMS